MVGAVRERVAVDHEERFHASDSSSSAIVSRSRSVAICAAVRRRQPVEIGDRDGRAVPNTQRAEPGETVGSRDPCRDQRDSRLERDPGSARVPTSLVLLAQPLLPARALGEHHDGVPLPAERDRGRDRLLVALAAADAETRLPR